MERSPPRQLLILSANLGMARPERIVESHMATFARRVSTVVPFAPDCVLLQEVVESSAIRVAQLLRQTTGFGFDVAMSPGPDAVVRRERDRIVIRNSAILLNRRTMRLQIRGAYIPSRYLSRDAAPGSEPRVKEHPDCLAETASGAIRLAAASVHFVTNDKLAARSFGFCYKGRWARQVARSLETRYPQGDRPQIWVIGGDFNNRRCIRGRETIACEVLPFWHVLTRQSGYLDAVFERHGGSDEELAAQTGDRKRIDYAFVRGRIIRASHDVGYRARKGDPGFYSDHRLLWALAGAESDE